MRSSVAVLFMTHFINDSIIAEARKLGREVPQDHDFVMLYNLTEHPTGMPPADVRTFTFAERDLRRLSYPAKSTDVASYNVELFVINFWRTHPDYDFYWVCENDVRFTGDWRHVFEAFAGNTADLLSTTIYRHSTFPNWENWRSLGAPAGVALSPEEKIASFLPFYRISNRALRAVHQGYADGWSGHCECTVPTIIARAGLTIEDIGGNGEFVRDGNINRFYRNTPANRTHGPGTLVFRPILAEPGDEPNMLWHPVKAGSAMVTSRRWKMARRARIMLKNGFAALEGFTRRNLGFNG